MKNTPSALLLSALAGFALNAHALCVNPDGSLDDASIPEGMVSIDVLPACDDPAPGAAGGTQKKAGVAVRQHPQPAIPRGEVTASDSSSAIKGDCRTADGESRSGSFGAAEMLPECD